MPITGKFIADFSAFQTAVKQAEVALTGMETNANKVGTSLNRMVDQFSGRKLVQDAQLMAQTFEHLAEKGIGLTTSELQRMGAVGSAAIEKLRASGEKVPPEIQKIVDAANKVKPAMDSAQSSAAGLFSTVQKAAGIFGIAFSVTAITRFVGSVFDAASAIQDLSESLGISTDAVQKFKFAAQQGGGTIDDVGRSIQFMEKALAEGSKDTYEALKLLGLGFDEVRRQSPEDALLSITDKLHLIEDPMLRTRLQMELLGKASKGLGASIATGFREAGEAADIMEKDTIKELEAAQQAWENFGNRVTIITGNMIADVMRITSSYDAFGKFVLGTIVKVPPALTDVQIAFDKAFQKKYDDQQRALNQTLGQTKVEATAAAEAIKKQAEAAKQLKTEWDAYITAALKRGDADIKYENQRTEAIKKTNEQMDKFVNTHLKELGDRGVRILGLTSDAAVKLALDLSGLHPVVEGLGDAFIKALDPKTFKVRDLPPQIDKVKFSLTDLSKALSDMATVAGGTFGAMASGFATIVSSANAAKISIQQIKDASKTTDKFEGILGMTTGIMGIVSAALAAVNAIKGIWGAINQREGRHAVEDFADSFGGFDALHAKLLELGDAGEQLWIKLTQGVPAGNADAAARVIAEIEAALGKQADAVDEVTTATEEQAQATIETASQAAKALEELGPRIDANKHEWKGWGDVVTAQIQRIADAVRALPLPGMPSAGAITAGSNGNGAANITVVSMLDGRQIAQSTARYLPDVIEGIA